MRSLSAPSTERFLAPVVTDEPEGGAAFGLGTMEEMQLTLLWARSTMTQGIGAEGKKSTQLSCQGWGRQKGSNLPFKQENAA